MIRKCDYYMADFETTVYEDQEFTEVWAAALVKFGTENVNVYGNIQDFMNECFYHCKNTNITVFFHNLKFDVAFILSYLITELQFEQAITRRNGKPEFLKDKQMKDKTFKYLCSDMGQWYSLSIRIHGHMCVFQDSLKLLPFSVKRIGKSFGTKHQKTEIEYSGFRYANCPISAKEKQYIKNDVLVVKEALEIMFSEGHKKITIASCCMNDYKKIFGKEEFFAYYPQLDALKTDKELFGSKNVDQYIRKAYKGGWCYVKKGRENKILNNGLTVDVNSLYPSMMHSMSGNRYPCGHPHFWRGNYIDDKALEKNRYFFITFQCRFHVKKDHLPFVQVKNSLMYKGNECLETSDICGLDGNYYRYYKRGDQVIDTKLTITMTQTDFRLFLDHYDVEDLEILHGCWFFTDIGIFDEYLNKWMKIKMESTGPRREIAKLFQNSFYGRFGQNDNSSFKFAYEKENGVIGFIPVSEHNKAVGYIPVAAAITSYARNFTIRAAQQNYESFVYADTDSLHLTCKPEEVKGCPIDPVKYCHWKLETQWDKGIFVRQKTYIEHVVIADGNQVEPYYNIKCAGMPQRCKDYLIRSFEGRKVTKQEKEEKKFDEQTEKFINEKRTMEDFKRGLIVPGKLIAKRIIGGIVLQESSYEMR